MKLSSHPAIIEKVAQAIYCDSYTQYGTNVPDRWLTMLPDYRKQPCRDQAVAALVMIEQALQHPGFSSTNIELIEKVGRAIYCDPMTEPGRCTIDRWRATSEIQRQFCRGQATASLIVVENHKG